MQQLFLENEQKQVLLSFSPFKLTLFLSLPALTHSYLKKALAFATHHFCLREDDDDDKRGCDSSSNKNANCRKSEESDYNKSRQGECVCVYQLSYPPYILRESAEDNSQAEVRQEAGRKRGYKKQEEEKEQEQDNLFSSE